MRLVPVGSKDRVTRYSHFNAAYSVEKWPRALIARRYRAFNDSIAFVPATHKLWALDNPPHRLVRRCRQITLGGRLRHLAIDLRDLWRRPAKRQPSINSTNSAAIRHPPLSVPPDRTKGGHLDVGAHESTPLQPIAVRSSRMFH